MPALVGAAHLEAEMAQQRPPDPVGQVLVVERRAQPVAEDVGREGTRTLLLALQGVIDQLRHLDVALRGVGLGVAVLAVHHCFPHHDQTPLEVDVLPLEAVDFAGAHAGEEAQREVVLEVGADGVDDLAHFVEREGIDVGALDPELFDVLERRAKIKAVGGFAEDLPQRIQDLVDPRIGQQLGLAPRRSFGEICAECKNVCLGDPADRHVPEAGHQPLVDIVADGLLVGLAPFDRLLAVPDFGEVPEQRCGRGAGNAGDGLGHGRHRDVWDRLVEANGVLAAGKVPAVAEGAEADLFLDLDEDFLETLAVGGGVREGRLFATAVTLKSKIDKQKPRIASLSDTTHGTQLRWPSGSRKPDGLCCPCRFRSSPRCRGSCGRRRGGCSECLRAGRCPSAVRGSSGRRT